MMDKGVIMVYIINGRLKLVDGLCVGDKEELKWMKCMNREVGVCWVK